MIVKKTDDWHAVSKILNHPKVFAFITDDAHPPMYNPNMLQFWIINEEETGVVRLDPINSTCCIAHIAALPELWGSAREFTWACLEWGFKNTTYSKVVAIVPEFNRLTVKLCERCGFETEGKIKKSFMKNYKYHDQIIFGITKTDFFF